MSDTQTMDELRAENSELVTRANELLTLLDRIEIEDDASLAVQRFDIIAKYGEIVWGPEVSGRMQ